MDRIAISIKTPESQMKNTPEINWPQVDAIIKNALHEDIRDGDATTEALFEPDETAKAYMLAKDNGIIAGLPIAERVFKTLQEDIVWQPAVNEGGRVKPRDLIVEMSGSKRTLLTGERLALNIMQRLSGIATMASQYMAEIDGLDVKILDTRKTLPGLRVMEKYAVAVGGATNHRFGLFDGIMIKDNHIKLAGGISKAVAILRANNPKGLQIEVETSNHDEVREALAAGADIIMLDNMPPDMMREAVEIIDGKALVEASGGINLHTVRAAAETGVDFVSVGALTHSVQALDIGMYFR